MGSKQYILKVRFKSNPRELEAIVFSADNYLDELCSNLYSAFCRGGFHRLEYNKAINMEEVIYYELKEI